MAFVSGGALGGVDARAAAAKCERCASSVTGTRAAVVMRMQIPNSPSELFRQNRAGSIGNPGLQSAGTAVLERPAVEKVPDSAKTDPGAPYKVILFDDPNHSKQYVVKTLMRVVPGMTFDTASNIAEDVHKTGSSVVGVWIFEVAEMYCDLLRSAGLKADLRRA